MYPVRYQLIDDRTHSVELSEGHFDDNDMGCGSRLTWPSVGLGIAAGRGPESKKSRAGSEQRDQTPAVGTPRCMHSLGSVAAAGPTTT